VECPRTHFQIVGLMDHASPVRPEPMQVEDKILEIQGRSSGFGVAMRTGCDVSTAKLARLFRRCQGSRTGYQSVVRILLFEAEVGRCTSRPLSGKKERLADKGRTVRGLMNTWFVRASEM
jgi:hypothetical protein